MPDFYVELTLTYRESARNLLYYLALRRRDIRPLQTQLTALGLSSLGRAESHVLATLGAVLKVLHDMDRRPWQPPLEQTTTVDFRFGQRLLAEHTNALLGPATPGRDVRIMVTMPSEAADDYTLVYNLLQHGMDCMRINCAHDDSTTWSRMIDHLKRAEKSLGRSCRIVEGELFQAIPSWQVFAVPRFFQTLFDQIRGKVEKILRRDDANQPSRFDHRQTADGLSSHN